MQTEASYESDTETSIAFIPSSADHVRPDPRITLLLGAVIIGLSAIFIKYAKVEGTTSSLYRTVIPSLVLVPYTLKRKQFFIPARLAVGALLGGVFLGLDLVLWSQAIYRTDPTIPTLLANLAPLWTGIGMWIIFRQRPRFGFWIGAIVAVVGAAVLAGVTLSGFAGLNKYHLLAAFASLFYAGYILVTQRIRADVANVTFLTYVCLGAAVTALVWSLVTGSSLVVTRPRALAALVGMGLGSQLFGWLCINHSLGSMETTKVSVTLLLQPVATGVFSFFIFHQRFSTHQIVGSIVILAGIAYVHLSGRSR